MDEYNLNLNYLFIIIKILPLNKIRRGGEPSPGEENHFLYFYPEYFLIFGRAVYFLWNREIQNIVILYIFF